MGTKQPNTNVTLLHDCQTLKHSKSPIKTCSRVLDCECCECDESDHVQKDRLDEIHFYFLICEMRVRGETLRRKP